MPHQAASLRRRATFLFQIGRDGEADPHTRVRMRYFFFAAFLAAGFFAAGFFAAGFFAGAFFAAGLRAAALANVILHSCWASRESAHAKAL
ncbi:MAG: hypothetical protein J0H94_09960 [Rhizobiales bacterium]|nr:hypothetical protein [Hyphomicrobiales bacterium]